MFDSVDVFLNEVRKALSELAEEYAVSVQDFATELMRILLEENTYKE